ncbi:MAG: phosphoserine transaminase [Sphaerochaetaceae bacterium]
MKINRKKNFFAGPSVLPFEVLEQLQQSIVDFNEEGLSIIEASHRDQPFTDMYYECLALVRELMGIPENYYVFFLGGGATLQFSMVPMNYLKPNQVADYIKSGTWSSKAASDAEKLGKINYYFDGKESNYSTLPLASDVKPSVNSSYLYLCSNETTGGLEWKEWPDTKGVPLIADMSSDILSRPVPVDKFDLIFAGVQKNLGPAGATLVVLNKEMDSRQNPNLPSYLNYSEHAKGDGLSNTPPIFSIWAVKLVMEWIKRNGGAAGMEKRSAVKSAILYDTIDNSGGFYNNPVDVKYRSTMNVVFKLPSKELEKLFVEESKAEGMVGLNGHRSVGGLRASIYNSLPIEDVQYLAQFMEEFQRTKG